MEEIRIIDVNHYHNDDFDELNIRIKPWVSAEFVDPVDEAHGFFLKVRANNEEVVGATILEADHWFDELAAAFKRRDLTHPDVRFFFEQKIRMFAAQWTAERDAEALAPSLPEPKRVVPEAELVSVTGEVVETQPT
jgi:hypothetical protein